MKVLHIMNKLLPSGAEVMLEKAAQIWDAEKMTIMSTTLEIGPFAEELERVGYSIVHIYDRSKLHQWYKILKYIKNEKFDAVHIHRESQSYIYATICKLAGIKSIVRTVHNVFLLNGIKRLREILTRRYEKILGVKYISISKSVYEHELSRFYNKTEIINNWYDMRKFQYVNEIKKKEARKKIGLNENTMCIVSVGNCSPIKNHQLVIKALGQIIPQLQGICDVKYFHIGYGQEELDERRMAEKLGIKDKIQFCGFTDPYEYLKAADVFVMPSVFEGVGISALEALAMGIPSILTDVYGLKDFKELNSDSVQFVQLTVDSVKDALLNCVKEFTRGLLKNDLNLANKVAKEYNMKSSIENYNKKYQIK